MKRKSNKMGSIQYKINIRANHGSKNCWYDTNKKNKRSTGQRPVKTENCKILT